MSDDRVPTLDYRTPGDEALAGRVLEAVRLRQLGGQARIVAKLVFGMPLCLVPPLLVAAVLVAIQHRIEHQWLYPGAIFPLACIILLPWMLWFEKRSRGRFLEDELRYQAATSDGPFRTSSYGEWELMRTTTQWIVAIHLLLTGARLVLSALEERREKEALRDVSLKRASEVLLTLLRAGQGVEISVLARRDETRPDLEWVLRFLIVYDWIGVSKDRSRAWILTTAKSALGGDRPAP